MQLVLENGQEHAPWVYRAFDVVCRELGIYDSDWIVVLRFQPNYESAGTHGYDRNCHKTSYIVLNSSNNNKRGVNHGSSVKFSLLESFCHEMVHVKQVIKDGLDSSYGPTVKWKGNEYDKLFLQVYADGKFPHEESPWEKEAYMKMLNLADKVEGRVTTHYPWLRKGKNPPEELIQAMGHTKL